MGIALVFGGIEVFRWEMRYQQPGYGQWGAANTLHWGAALVCLLGLGGIIMGQSIWDPVNDVCNIQLARAIVLGDKMYMDGGQIVDKQYYPDLDKPTLGTMNQWQSGSPSII